MSTATFLVWFLAQRDRQDCIGDLVRNMQADTFPVEDSDLWIHAIRLIREGYPTDDDLALVTAWRAWEREGPLKTSDG